jgi:cytochrome c-type biogenesis protein
MVVILLAFIPIASAESNIKNVTYSPEVPFPGEAITVYMVVNDTSNITNVRLLYCQIEPSYLCYTPLYMTLKNNNTYTINITENLEDITRLGFNITLTYYNGSMEYSPKEGTYHYVNFTGEGPKPPCPTENTLALQFLVVALIVVLIFMVIGYIRDKKRAKPINKKIFGVLTVVIVVLAGAALTLFFLGQEEGEIKEAPNFTLTDIDGNTFNLTDLRDQVVLLDMMSIPCDSCKIVEKNLKDIYPDYKDEVIFISIDILAEDTDEMLRAYRDSHEIEWIIARDTDEVILKYHSQAVPKVVIINATGYATYENSGITSKGTLKKELDKAIQGEAEAINIQQASYISLALLAGFVFFFSPCAFPMLPGYMAYYLKKGAEKGGKIPLRKAAIAGIISAVGIIIVSLIIGIVAIFAGTSILKDVGILGLIVGIILIVLGGLLLTPFQYWKIIRPFQTLWAQIRKTGRKKEGAEDPTGISTDIGGNSGFYGGLFLYGLGYGAAAAGCTAPIFIAVLVAALSAGLIFGLLVLILYNLVAAILMISITIAIAYFGAGAAQKLSQYTEKIKKISGAVLIVVGIYLIWFYWAATA